MRFTFRRSIRKLATLPALLATLFISHLAMTIAAHAGPPLVCHPIEIASDAETLPWGDGPFDKVSSYDVKNLVDDTLKYLDDDAVVLTRMETLRRAAIYARENRAMAMQLLSELEGRVLDAVASGRNAEHAWFDAGYLVQIYKQYDLLPRNKASLDGYAWVKRAAELEPNNADVHFALAMICSFPDRPERDAYLKRAVDGTHQGTMLAKNIEIHFDATLDELQDRLAGR